MKKKLEQEVKVSSAQIKKIVEGDMSKSQKMKALFDLGMSVKEIANALKVRYNFVYNVISNYVGMTGIETVTEKREGKKEQIIELYKQGKSLKEIGITLKTNYNYVFNVVKQFKREQEAANNSEAKAE